MGLISRRLHQKPVTEITSMALRYIAALALLALSAQALYLTRQDPEQVVHKWEHFKHKFNKTYPSQSEEAKRQAIWKNNTILIDAHNKQFHAGNSTFRLGENEFADMTAKEFAAKFNGLKKRANDFGSGRPVADFGNLNTRDLPKHVDWRTKGYVTGIKNQQQCGSCWAFSATGSMEGAHFKKTGKLVSLSEQNLVDCVTKDFGCNGGLPGDAFQYVIKNHGIDTESSYPYTARDGQCHYSSATEGATFSEAVAVESKNEDALKKAVATVGPVSVGIDASHFSFQLYKRGVYYCRFCSQTRLDHGVLVVGYGNEDGHDYWMVKNSWGSNYGENGYIKMSRNRNNNCGIATMANYPVA